MANTTGYDVYSVEASGASDVAFNKDQTKLFVAKRNGDLDVVDVRTHQVVATWHVGTSLEALSLSEDGSFLLITERQPPSGQSVLYRVDTATGATSSLSVSGGAPFRDVEIVDAHNALIDGGGQNAIRTVSLDTGLFSTVNGGYFSSGAGTVFKQDTRYTLFAETGISNGPLFLYDRNSGTISASGDDYQSPNVSGFNWGSQALSEQAGLVVQFIYYNNLNLYDLSLHAKGTVTISGPVDGLLFDPTGKYLYAYQVDGHVTEYDTATWGVVQQFTVAASTWHNDLGYGDQLLLSADGRYMTVMDSYASGGRLEIIDLTQRDEQLTGTEGDDQIHGGAGDDVLHGLGGADTLYGEAGNDVIDGGAGVDTVDYSAETGGNAIIANLSGDTLFVAGRIAAAHQATDSFFTTDSLSGIENVKTGSGNDLVIGDEGANRLETGAGNDYLDGRAGADTLIGGTGDDIYVVDDAGDVVTENAGEGTDEIRTALASFTLTIPNVENLTGLASTGQTLTGNALANVITGGAGGDTLSGGGGGDTLSGGDGDDAIAVQNGHDRVDGGADSDLLVVDYSGATAAVAVSGIQMGTGAVGGWQGHVSDAGAGGSHDVLFDNIERLDLTTGSGNDFVAGIGGPNIIHTGLGNDTLTGGGGGDVLDGGAGADYMFGAQGNDVFYVDDAGDTVVENGSEGNADEVRTSLTGYVLPANVEKLTWIGAGAGDLRGNGLDNVLTGGAAGDFVRAQDGGNDVVNLGGGNDAVYFGSAYTSGDSADGGTGSDQVALQGDYSGGVTLGTLAGVETLVAMTHSDVRFGGGSASPFSYNIVAPDATVAAGTQLMLNASTLEAGENLTFNGSAETNGSFFIYGGKGIDTLTGGAGADVFFFAEDGRFAATDHIDGGAGQDVLVLRGNYSLTLSGTSIVNVETVVLNSGSDARFYTSGTPFSYDITTADDTVAAGQTMTFNGGALSAAETLHFDGSLETNGNFRLFGGSADDVIKGGAGNDLIYGGLGHDDLTGGAGADTFRYQGAGESTVTATDRILDFSTGDVIDLGRIDAVAGGNDDAFHIVGAFDGQAGELVLTEGANNVWTVSGDVDGNGQADFQILVTVSDAHQLTSGDFVL